MLALSSRAHACGSGLDRFRAEGCLKALFPRGPRVEAIVINTSGGLTGGDALRIDASAGPASTLCLTTQAAERVYRSAEGEGVVSARLSVAPGAALFWLPQETIVFDGGALRRSLRADIAGDGRLLLVEPLVFGRTAMGERVTAGRLHDTIEIFRDGKPLYIDRRVMSGDVAATLSRRAVGNGAIAAASLVHVGADAASMMAPVRAGLPATGGASLLAEDVLALRLVARDGFELRRHLLPVLDLLTRQSLPRSWRL